MKFCFEFEEFKKSEEFTSENIIKEVIEDSCNDTEAFEKILFQKYYEKLLVSNPSCYSIKRSSPFIFLINLIELSINHFSKLFNFANEIKRRIMLIEEVVKYDIIIKELC